ncbi:MAG: hypothetical protein VW516_14060, partial [Rhodospirillaceae bacterium]
MAAFLGRLREAFVGRELGIARQHGDFHGRSFSISRSRRRWRAATSFFLFVRPDADRARLSDRVYR